ncbi:MAG TPA: hypothetical protein VFR93_08150 [Candidatus Limnocylindrales bacterium]|nr:hypothetical protein [Candidatus Limnocylindrales bacterium]
MRVRRFELRLLAGVIAVAWALFAGLVLILYRPGGPADAAVVVVATLPTVVGIAALLHPPVTHSTRAFAAVVWLGIGVALVLVPSIGGLLGQLEAGGTQTLLPSLESAYPWLLALAGTSLFAGLGLARARLGASALRGRVVAGAVAIALLLTVSIGTLFAAAAIGNDLALRDRPATASRFGPTDPNLPIPTCDGPLGLPSTATVAIDVDGTIDARSLGSVSVDGARAGTDADATIDDATTTRLGRRSARRIGADAWIERGGRWTRADPAAVSDDLALDDRVLATVLDRRNRATAEFRGEEYVEGARARHCRVAVDGPTFLRAFPESAALVGPVDLHRWRGEVDYWVFADGSVGRVSGAVNGDGGGLPAPGILGTVDVAMTIVDRGRPVAIARPVAG